MKMEQSNPPTAVGSNAGLGLVERLRQRTLPKHGGREADSWAHHWNLTPGDSELHAEAAKALRDKDGMLDRMDSELRNERDARSIVQRALIMAAMLPHNQAKPAGAVREAAVALFGQEAVDAAMNVWRPNVRGNLEPTR